MDGSSFTDSPTVLLSMCCNWVRRSFVLFFFASRYLRNLSPSLQIVLELNCSVVAGLPTLLSRHVIANFILNYFVACSPRPLILCTENRAIMCCYFLSSSQQST